jgi:hypothetical protein
MGIRCGKREIWKTLELGKYGVRAHKPFQWDQVWVVASPAEEIDRRPIRKHGNDFDVQFLSCSELLGCIKRETKSLNYTDEAVYMIGV